MKIHLPPKIFVVVGLICGGAYTLVQNISNGSIEHLSAAAVTGQFIGGAFAGLMIGSLSGLCFNHLCGSTSKPAISTTLDDHIKENNSRKTKLRRKSYR